MGEEVEVVEVEEEGEEGRGADHVHALLGVAQGEEDVAEEHQGAARQPWVRGEPHEGDVRGEEAGGEGEESGGGEGGGGGGPPVEVLGVGGLECLPKEPLALPVLLGEERLPGEV